MSVLPDYELQLDAIIRAKKTLGIDVFLTNPPEGENPMDVTSLSRFKLTLVDKTGSDTITPWCNIPAKDVSYIHSMKGVALLKKADAALIVGTDSSTAQASTTRLKFGEFSGKTPLEVISSNPANKEKLLHTKKLLQANESKYPANTQIIKDIDAAIALAESGKVEDIAKSSPCNNIITVYDEKYKPLRSQSDGTGRCMVYSVSMICDTSKRYPWELTIENCFAKLKTASGGATIPDMSTAINQKKSTILLNDKEFCRIVDRMHHATRDFESANFMAMYKMAQNINARKREAYKKNLA